MLKENNKIFTTILLLLTLIIWGGVIVRFTDFFDGGNTNNVVVPVSFESYRPTYKVDSFELYSEFRDPFLGKIERSSSTSRVRVRQPIQQPVVENPIPEVEVEFPYLSYNGVIVKGSDNVTYMINTSKNSYMINSKMSFEGINVVFLSKDSIVFEYSGVRKKYP